MEVWVLLRHLAPQWREGAWLEGCQFLEGVFSSPSLALEYLAIGDERWPDLAWLPPRTPGSPLRTQRVTDAAGVAQWFVLSPQPVNPQRTPVTQLKTL